MGSAVLSGKATDVIDASHYLERAYHDWFSAGEEKRRSNGTRKRVLLVDDSPFFRNLLSPVLSVAGFSVTSVDSGSAAMELCERGEDFDIIVSDIEMPGMSGFDLAAAVRENSRWAEVPLVALSSHTSSEDLERGRAAGFSDYVAKSDREALLHTLSQTLTQIGDAG
jgi:two-component system chemotaxis sensor kinase CheA